MDGQQLAALFPPHKASLSLEHNDHKSCYETVEQWDLGFGDHPFYEWVSPEQRQKAIDTDSVWTLQWYPDTPVGFCALAAADLDVLLTAATADDPAESLVAQG